MIRHTLKISQHLLQDFQSVPEHFGTLCIKGLKAVNKTKLLAKRTHSRMFDRVLNTLLQKLMMYWKPFL